MKHVVVIGGGPGGYVAAIKSAQAGLETTLVERDLVGGTCLNRGCVPTKTLVHTAEIYDELSHGAEIGLVADALRIDFAALRARKQAVVEQLRDGIESLLAANGVKFMRGTGRVVGQGCVEVIDGGGMTTTVECDDIIIATGSAPARPPIEGIDLEGVYDSDGILDELPELDSLAIVGGGVIGMEFAGFYTATGAEVHVLEAGPRVLSSMDREFGQGLAMSMKKKGCRIHANARVLRVSKAGDALAVTFMHDDVEETVETAGVLVACGRRTNLEAVFPGDFMPESTRGRIDVDEGMRTSLPGVYAIGDVANAGLQLAHAASAQGIVAACAIAGMPCRINLGAVPSCVYVSPEIASIGITEAEAKSRGMEASVAKYATAGNAKSLITRQDRGFVKIMADRDGTIVGAHLMCGRATDIIGELGLAVACGLKIEDLERLVRAHPTFEEAVGEAVEAFGGGSIHSMPRKRVRR